MKNTDTILNEVKRIIKNVCDKGELYDGSEVMKLMDQLSDADAAYLKSEAESIIKNEPIISDRFHAIYLRSLLWTLLKYDRQFVTDTAVTLLENEFVLNKEPWVVMLEELDELDAIAVFFKKNIGYGDRFFQEKMLYILSDTNIQIGDHILAFLNSEYEILSEAALRVLDDQNLNQYYSELLTFFIQSRDADLLIIAAKILMKWDGKEASSNIGKKIAELEQSNPSYFYDTIKELNIILTNQNS